MKYIVLICAKQCDGKLLLSLDVEEKKLIAICNKCGTLYQIVNIDLDDEDVEKIKKSVLEPKSLPPLFYSRATRETVAQ